MNLNFDVVLMIVRIKLFIFLLETITNNMAKNPSKKQVTHQNNIPRILYQPDLFRDLFFLHPFYFYVFKDFPLSWILNSGLLTVVEYFTCNRVLLHCGIVAHLISCTLVKDMGTSSTTS